MTNIKTITALSRYIKLTHPDTGYILFYCSSAYSSLPTLALSMQCLFKGLNVVGCTTACEISSAQIIKPLAGFDLLDAQKTIN